MAEHIERMDTTNRRRGSSGGFTVEDATEGATRPVPLPAKGEEQAGDPFTASTTKFQEADRQVVPSRQVGSGD